MKHFETQDDAIKAVLKGWGDDSSDAAYSDARDFVLALKALGLIDCQGDDRNDVTIGDRVSS